MPIYEFECLKCGEVFELLQKRDDPPPKKHHCGSRRVRKVMSQSSFILKGSGWYITDYARKGKTDGSGSEGASEGSKSKGDSQKGDSQKGDSKKSGGKKASKDPAPGHVSAA